MSTRRKLERSIKRARGETSGGGMVAVSEIRAEATEIANRLIPIAFQRQPVSPLAVLLALEVTRQHVVLLVEESTQSEESKARFWESVNAELAAYHAAIEARRS